MFACMECDFEALHALGDICGNAVSCAFDTHHRLAGVSNHTMFLLVPV